jgi:hypothetical protein
MPKKIAGFIFAQSSVGDEADKISLVPLPLKRDGDRPQRYQYFRISSGIMEKMG